MGQNCNLQFAINWMRSRNVGFQVEMKIVWNSFFPILWNSIPRVSIFHFNVFPFAQRHLLLRRCRPLSIQVCLFFTLSFPFSCSIQFLAWIAERGLALDPLHPPMKSNCTSIPASTSTTKSPVFVAKLKNWKMYFTIFFLCLSFDS